MMRKLMGNELSVKSDADSIGRSVAYRANKRDRAVLFADAYLWFVFLSALDVLFTAVVLHMGGREVNVVANWILARWDLSGMVVFKFVLVAFVLMACEIVGKAHWKKGRWLAVIAVAITCVPVILSYAQFLRVVLATS